MIFVLVFSFLMFVLVYYLCDGYHNKYRLHYKSYLLFLLAKDGERTCLQKDLCKL